MYSRNILIRMKFLNNLQGFWYILVTSVTISVLVYNHCFKNKQPIYLLDKRRKKEMLNENVTLIAHYNIVNNYFEKRKNWTTSNLGSILFKNIDISNFKQQNRSFTIWIHKYWKYFNWRFNTLENYSRHCSVKNCKFIPNPTEKVDALLVNLWYARFPTNKRRHKRQIWIFFSEDSPQHKFNGAFFTRRNTSIKVLANMFNWSSSYRHDADIPVPYGRVVALKRPIIPNFQMSNYKYYSPKYAEQMLNILVPNWEKKRRDVLVTIMYSNCMKERQKAIDLLSHKVEVHVYGGCSKDPVTKKSCQTGWYMHIGGKCLKITKYLFYLVIENSKCIEYITEKSFYNGFTLGAIPIMIGPSITDCQLHLPPNSFIYVQELEELRDLGDKLIKIAHDRRELLKYHEWRNHFTVDNDHGYFRTESKYMCRICEGLNYNNITHNVYDLERIKSVLDPEITCWK